MAQSAHISTYKYTHVHTYTQSIHIYTGTKYVQTAKQLHILLAVSNNYEDRHYLCVARTNSNFMKEDLFWLTV